MNKISSFLLSSLCVGTCSMNLFAMEIPENQTPFQQHQSFAAQIQIPGIPALPINVIREARTTSGVRSLRAAFSAQVNSNSSPRSSRLTPRTQRQPLNLTQNSHLSSSLNAQTHNRPIRYFAGGSRVQQLQRQNVAQRRNITEIEPTRTQLLRRLQGAIQRYLDRAKNNEQLED